MPPSSLPSTSLPLGHPLPLDEHACSVSLPTWSSVVGYEEGSTEVTEKLACGYPRFVYHPYVLRLMDAALKMDEEFTGKDASSFDCLVLPTRKSALRCHDFLAKACGYFDGQAVSPRLADCGDGVSSNAVRQIIGDSRIKLFSEDNSIDRTIEDVDSLYNAESPLRVIDMKAADLHAVIFPAQTVFAIEAKSYWQHTGEVVSSRRAEVALAQLGLGSNNSNSEENHVLKRVTTSFQNDAGDWKICKYTKEPYLALYPSEDESSYDGINIDPFTGIKDRIASVVNTPSSSVFLTASGMSSIYTALRSARRHNIHKREEASNCVGGIGGTSVVFGFPYLDTLKMCSRPELVPGGVEFFGHGNDSDLQNLEQMLKDRSENNPNGDAGVSVLITEYPSNPLLNCPNLQKLRSLADEYGFAVVVDDTIGNFANVDLIENGMADAVCTSLTKLFNGRGDAMAGSVVTNPNTKMGRWMQEDLELNHNDNEGLWIADATAIFKNSEDFLERSSKINVTSEALADWLNDREEVATVYYPKFTDKDGYNSVMKKYDYGGKHKAGYGGLMSIILHPHICQRTFYDEINVSKGPSLGTDFSLSCPYTLLAHYHELNFAMSYDVQPNLIRFAIGLEDIDELKEKFDYALKKSKLHPKLPNVEMPTSQIRGYCCGNTSSTLTRSVVRPSPLFNVNSFGMRSLSKPFFYKRDLSTDATRKPITTAPIDFRYAGSLGSRISQKSKFGIQHAARFALLRKI